MALLIFFESLLILLENGKFLQPFCSCQGFLACYSFLATRFPCIDILFESGLIFLAFAHFGGSNHAALYRVYVLFFPLQWAKYHFSRSNWELEVEQAFAVIFAIFMFSSQFRFKMIFSTGRRIFVKVFLVNLGEIL